MDKLGKKAKDKVTGFEGVIIGKCTYLFGCDQYGIAPPAKDGKLGDCNWFDKGRIEITGEGVKVEEVQGDAPGGMQSEAPTGRY